MISLALTNKEYHLIEQMRSIDASKRSSQAIIFAGSIQLAEVVRDVTDRIVALAESDEPGEVRALLMKVRPDIERRIVQAMYAHEALDHMMDLSGQHETLDDVEEDDDDFD